MVVRKKAIRKKAKKKAKKKRISKKKSSKRIVRKKSKKLVELETKLKKYKKESATIAKQYVELRKKQNAVLSKIEEVEELIQVEKEKDSETLGTKDVKHINKYKDPANIIELINSQEPFFVHSGEWICNYNCYLGDNDVILNVNKDNFFVSASVLYWNGMQLYDYCAHTDDWDKSYYEDDYCDDEPDYAEFTKVQEKFGAAVDNILATRVIEASINAAK
jgi:hypothetical protein